MDIHEPQLTIMTPEDLARKMGMPIAMALEALPADMAVDMLRTMFLAPLLCCLEDDKWSEMMVAGKQPCGKPDCNCHVVSGLLFDALNLLRMTVKKKKAEQDNAKSKTADQAI